MSDGTAGYPIIETNGMTPEEIGKAVIDAIGEEAANGKFEITVELFVIGEDNSGLYEVETTMSKDGKAVIGFRSLRRFGSVTEAQEMTTKFAAELAGEQAALDASTGKES